MYLPCKKDFTVLVQCRCMWPGNILIKLNFRINIVFKFYVNNMYVVKRIRKILANTILKNYSILNGKPAKIQFSVNPAYIELKEKSSEELFKKSEF